MKRVSRRGSSAAGILVLFALLAAARPVPAGGAPAVSLVGLGATFPYPFYTTVFDVFARKFGVQIEYRGVGSGEGIRQFLAGKVDFAGTDVFMTPQEMRAAGGEVVHVPTCLSAVAVICNLPAKEVPQLTPDVLAGIFMGRIQQWNDPRIVSINPGRTLSASKILVVHRSDDSGTTHILSEYLTKVSQEWKAQVGAGRALKWPSGTGAQGNPGVAGQVQQRPGSIGYVELTYALGNDLKRCAIRNRSGRFILPTSESVRQAAQVPFPADTNISLTDTPAAEGYPVSGLTWLVLHRELCVGNRTPEAARLMASLVWWVIHDGQGYAADLGYAPLSPEGVRRGEALLQSLTYAGRSVLTQSGRGKQEEMGSR